MIEARNSLSEIEGRCHVLQVKVQIFEGAPKD